MAQSDWIRTFGKADSHGVELNINLLLRNKDQDLDFTDKHPAASIVRLSAFCLLPPSLAPKLNALVKVRLASSAQHSISNVQLSSFGTVSQARLFATAGPFRPRF